MYKSDKITRGNEIVTTVRFGKERSIAEIQGKVGSMP